MSYPHTVIAKEINENSKDENYQWKVELIYLDVISIQVMSVNTGAVYKLNLEKNKEWCKKNLMKLQNDFSQLYSVIDEAVFNKDGLFSYTINEDNDNLKLIIKTNPETKFFKLELDIDIPRFISEDGLISDKLNCVEYQLNKLKEDFKTLQKLISMNSQTQTKTGKQKIYNECGNLVYSGEMKNGKRDGYGIQYCPDSGQIIYEGQFKDGYYDGEGIYRSAQNPCVNKNYYKGSFSKGLYNGNVETYWISYTKKITEKDFQFVSKSYPKLAKSQTVIYNNGIRVSYANWLPNNGRCDLSNNGVFQSEKYDLDGTDISKFEIPCNNQAIQDEN